MTLDILWLLLAFCVGYLARRLIDRAVGLRVSPEAELREQGAVEPGTEVGEITARYNRVIAELNQAMAEVRSSAERYRRTVDNALDAIVTVDEHGVILGWNPRAAAIFGWTRAQALGEDVFELITRPQDREGTRDGLLSFLTAGGDSTLLGQRIEVTGVHRDGRELPIEATFTMAALGERPEFNLFFQDITARQRARLALHQAKESAEAATRAKSEFLANMSHEIRTPMNGIIGIIELMLDAGPSRRQRRYLEMIRTSADALLRLLDDVLNYAKFESGKIELQAVEFALRGHLVDLLGALAIQARKKGLDLVCRVDPEVPDLLIGDPVRLGQVIINLVANGIKFTPEGEVDVDVALLSLEDTRAVLELIVNDTGPGIPVDKREAIFHPFEQAGVTTAQRYAGAGLGLAICKSLVESMGGQIGIDGKPSPGGSTFRFECPFDLPAAVTTAPDAAADAGQGASRELRLLDFDDDDGNPEAPAADRREPELGPGRVLVVEDNRINQVVAEGMLEAWGLEVEIASSGTEALAAFERRSFDLVLTDMRMPDLDGFAVTAAIRGAGDGSGSAPLRSDVPIIAMTANVAPGDRRKCLDAGMDGYVAKPIHKPELLAAVRAALMPEAPEDPLPEDRRAPPEDRRRAIPPAGTVFDRETLLRRVGGRHERAQKLASIFLEEDGPHHRAALGRAFAERDAPAIQGAAHALRGAAGEVCAPAVAAAAERLEAATLDPDPRRIEKKYETLDREIQKLTLSLEAFLEARASQERTLSGDSDERH